MGSDVQEDLRHLSASIQRDPPHNRLSVRCPEFPDDGGLLGEWRRRGGQVEGPTPEEGNRYIFTIAGGGSWGTYLVALVFLARAAGLGWRVEITLIAGVAQYLKGNQNPGFVSAVCSILRTLEPDDDDFLRESRQINERTPIDQIKNLLSPYCNGDEAELIAGHCQLVQKLQGPVEEKDLEKWIKDVEESDEIAEKLQRVLQEFPNRPDLDRLREAVENKRSCTIQDIKEYIKRRFKEGR